MALIEINAYKAGSCCFPVLIHQLQAVCEIPRMTWEEGEENFTVFCDETHQAAILQVISDHDKEDSEAILEAAETDRKKAEKLLSVVCTDPEDEFKDVQDKLNDEQKNQNRAAFSLLIMLAELINLHQGNFTDQTYEDRTYTAEMKWNAVNPDAVYWYPPLTNMQYAKLVIDRMVGTHLEMEYQRTQEI